MKEENLTCYCLKVTNENEPLSIIKTTVNVVLIEGKRFLVSDMRSARKVYLRNPKRKMHLLVSEAEKGLKISLGMTSMTGFLMDVILREDLHKTFYANDKNHLLRFCETCFEEYIDNIKAALETIDS